MTLDFQPVLAALNQQAGGNFAFTVANSLRPPSDYLLAMFLPERNMEDYAVDSGNMTILPTMAGLVGMDSPYPPGGAMTVSSFLEKTAKFAIEVPMTEAARRQLRLIVQRLALSGASASDQMAQEVLNFTSLVLVQSLQDVAEYLRGRALGGGAIDWTFNGINLKVDYGLPASHTPATRTGADAYGAAESKFWDDHRTALKLLGAGTGQGDISIISHVDFVYELIDNEANKVRVASADNGVFELVRYTGSVEQNSTDARDRIRVYAYQAEGAFLNPNDPQAEPTKVQFFPSKTLSYVRGNGRRGYRVGQGPQEAPEDRLAIGYTHLAPTEEGGTPGRWAQVYTPEQRPYALHGRAVQNLLPVIENEKGLVILTSE